MEPLKINTHNHVRVLRPTLTQEHFIRDFKTPVISFRSAVNQGKTTCIPAKGIYNARIQHPDKYGVRHSAGMIIRGTQAQLLDTTVKAVEEWFPPSLMKIRKSQPIQGVIKGMKANDQDQYFPHVMHYKDNLGRPIEAPYTIGATKNKRTGLYEGGQDVSGMRIGDVFPKGTTITSHWRFMAVDSPTWEGDVLSTNFGWCLIDEADQVEDLMEKLPILDGRLGRAPSADVAPCTVKQLGMCYNPPDEGTDLEKLHRPGSDETKFKLYEMPPPIVKIDYVNERGEVKPDDYINCTYVPNPDAEGLHFATEGAAFWLDKAEKFSTNSHYIQRSLLGLCPRAGGSGQRIFDFFDSLKHVKVLKPTRKLKLVVSLDHGNTPCASFCQWDIGLRVVDELYDDDMLAPVFYRDHLMPYLRSKYGGFDIVITGDPSGSTVSGAAVESLFDIFRMDYEVVDNLVNDKEMRWDAVNYYLKPADGFLIDPKCERHIGGLNGGYQFDALAKKRGMRKAQKSGPNGVWSHMQDALQGAALYFRGGWEYRAETAHRMEATNDADEYSSRLVV